jgi:probable HAF family extracellular repeat protein
VQTDSASGDAFMWFFRSRKSGLKTLIRPRLEALEDRWCPSGTSYTVTDLGLSPVSYGSAGFLNGHETTRLGINNALQVVGMAGTGNPSVASNHAFVWQNGVFTDLGTLGGPTSRATAINNAASPEIVGWADTTAVDSSGHFIHHACLWQQNGTGGWSITDLGTLGGNNSAAYAINQSGQVVGDTDTTNPHHPFVWQNGVITDLNNVVTTYAGSLYTAYGINDQGQITGGLYNQSIYPYPYRGYLLTPSAGNPSSYTVTVLPPFNNQTGANAWALSVITANMGMSINSSTQVAGVLVGYAAYWPSPTKVSNLGNTKNGGGAFGINNSGEVVGVFGNNSTNALNAFLRQDAKSVTNLNSLIPSNSGWNLIEADSINDPTPSLPSGSIVGYGIYSDGQTHMFLAIDPPGEDGATAVGAEAPRAANTAMLDKGALIEASLVTPLLPNAGMPLATMQDAARVVASPPAAFMPAPIVVSQQQGTAQLSGGGEETVDLAFIDWQSDAADDIASVQPVFWG